MSAHSTEPATRDNCLSIVSFIVGIVIGAVAIVSFYEFFVTGDDTITLQTTTLDKMLDEARFKGANDARSLRSTSAPTVIPNDATVVECKSHEPNGTSGKGGDAFEAGLPVLFLKGTCYYGDQAAARFAELDKQFERAEKQNRDDADKATADFKIAIKALAALATKEGVLSDESWRELAITFARDSKLRMAYEAAQKAFTDHGGDPQGFYYDVNPKEGPMEAPDAS